MTYCVGFKYRDSVYLIADSAVTAEGPRSSSSVSSFGEAPHVDTQRVVDERALKLVTIGQNCMVALAGDLARAFGGVEILRSAYPVSADIPALLRALTQNIDAASTDHFEYLIATVGAEGPQLWHWSSKAPNAPTPMDNIAQIGSLATWHPYMTGAIVDILRAGRIPADRLLSITTAIIQSYGLRDRLLDHGVGGVVAGAQIQPSGIRWLPDTNYLIHDPRCTSVDVASIYCRDGGIAVSSSFNNETRAFLSCMSQPEVLAWEARWSAELKIAIDRVAARVWVFIGLVEMTIFVVEAPEATSELPCCKVARWGAGKYDVAMHPVFVAALTARAPSPPDAIGNDSRYFRLSYAAAESCLEHASQWLNRRHG